MYIFIVLNAFTMGQVSICVSRAIDFALLHEVQNLFH